MKTASRFGGSMMVDGATVCLFVSIALYWLTHIEAIGLHGDEAWGGLEAIRIIRQGVSRPFGIVPHTGLLQSLANAGVFINFDVGVTQLRVTGIFCNVIAVGILVYCIRTTFSNVSAFFLLLFFGQSAFYLLYAKISWEVCSFNLLFISLLLVSGYYVYTHQFHWFKWSFVFLFISLLAGYNHIIFSCLLMAGLLGVIVWVLFGKEPPSKGVVIVSVILFYATLNSLVLYLGLRYYASSGTNFLSPILLFLPVTLILAEYFAIRLSITIFFNLLSRLAFVQVHQAAKMLFVAICVGSFGWYHGGLLVNVYSQKIVFMHILLYPLSGGAGMILILVGSLILSLFYYLFVKDILYENSAFAYVLMSYLAILNIYTTIPSMRYLLTAGVLMFLYLSIRIICERPAVQYIAATLLLISLVTVQSTLWEINSSSNRKVKPSYFTLNHDFMDNSAHFLNFSPVLEYIHREKVGQIRTREKFFIGNVFDFYQQTQPTIMGYQNTMEINYDYAKEGSGFEMSIAARP
ncbi:hypothetical protein [Dawidia soli]|uniref:Uncharacterized protein n=1 Tax=Dawidia soli TaxID=2782352 RepID=A0AAP2DGD0_9BACT|nr:hypothetical protein [Dawidia soli]MBT1690797.1 hypothetical protein [Dawidia soli]